LGVESTGKRGSKKGDVRMVAERFQTRSKSKKETTLEGEKTKTWKSGKKQADWG